MRVVNPSHKFDRFSKDEWTQFLKDGAHRGCKINKAAKKTKNKRLPELIKDQNLIKLTYDKRKEIILNMDNLVKNHDRWTLSRLIHNIKMCVSKRYVEKFNARIEKLSDLIIKSKTPEFTLKLQEFVDDQNIDTHTQEKLKTFFNENSRLIDGIYNNKEVQENLFKLSRKVEDSKLAHLINSKAAGLTPPSNINLETLPSDVQRIIYSQITQDARDIHKLFVSKEVSKNVYSVKNTMINAGRCLKRFGCKTAKEAVAYIIRHQLTSANLSAFYDFDDEDLEGLRKCSQLKKIAISSKKISGLKLVDVFKSFTHLQALDLSHKKLEVSTCVGFSTDQIAEIIESHPNLQKLDLSQLEINDRIVKAIINLVDLQELNLYASREISRDQIAEILEKHTNLQSLNLNSQILHDRAIKAIINLVDLQELNLYASRDISTDQIAEILEKHVNLQSLNLNYQALDDRVMNVVVNLSNLRNLSLNSCLLMTLDDVEKIIKRSPHLEGLDLSYCKFASRDLSSNDVKALAKKFPNLKIIHRQSIRFIHRGLVKL